MEIYYKPYRRNMREILQNSESFAIFCNNLLVHLHNINAAAHKTPQAVKKIATATPSAINNTAIAARKDLSILAKKVRSVAEILPVFKYYDMLFASCVKSTTEFVCDTLAATRDCLIKAHKRYRVLHLKDNGKAPVIVNIGLNSSKQSDIAFAGDFKKILDNNQKRNGIVILNSAGSYYECAKKASKFKGNVCIVSNNGALVTAKNAQGRQVVLRDRKIPESTVKSLYEYLKKPENINLMKDYYMVIEGDINNKLSVVDFESGKVKNFSEGKFISNEILFESAMSNAYGVRFVAKNMSKIARQGDGNFLKAEQLNAGAKQNNALAGKAAQILCELPKDIREALNIDTNIQFGRNGSIDLVPKGCSKQSAAQLIADYYGFSHDQILTVASSVNDVCKPVSLDNIREYIEKGGSIEEMPTLVNAIDSDLIAKPDKFCVPYCYLRNFDIKNLYNKLDSDIDFVNRNVFAYQLKQEYAQFAAQERAKISFAEKKAEMEDLRIRHDDESMRRYRELVDELRAEVDNYKTLLNKKQEELKAREFKPTFAKNKYILGTRYSIVGKINALSKNEDYHASTRTRTM